MRKAMIEIYVRELRGSYGTKKPVDDNKLEVMYSAQDYHGMMSMILEQFSLNLRVKLGLVNSGGPNAPAWVRGIDTLPLYGTNDFKSAEVTVFIRKTFLAEASFESVVLALAHEASHIILTSTFHSLRKHEEAVDLTAMMFGFRDFYVTGCMVHLRQRSYRLGYLTKEEVGYAANFITFGR